jgi:hypothetical protein
MALKFQVVKMLACVVFIFATLWVPYRGMLVYNTFNAGSPYMDLWSQFDKTFFLFSLTKTKKLGHLSLTNLPSLV